jgi:hypothetical protein
MVYTKETPPGRGCGSCSRASENRAWDCPPRMADGRLFTDYRPQCVQSLQYREDAMQSSHDYRQYMIQHGISIINQERDQAAKKAECGPCVLPYHLGTMAPEADQWVCNKQTCKRVATGMGGMAIGTGRSYGLDPSLMHVDRENKQYWEERQSRLTKSPANCCGCGSSADIRRIKVRGSPSRFATPGAGIPLNTSSTDPLVSCGVASGQ